MVFCAAYIYWLDRIVFKKQYVVVALSLSTQRSDEGQRNF